MAAATLQALVHSSRFLRQHQQCLVNASTQQPHHPFQNAACAAAAAAGVAGCVPDALDSQQPLIHHVVVFAAAAAAALAFAPAALAPAAAAAGLPMVPAAVAAAAGVAPLSGGGEGQAVG